MADRSDRFMADYPVPIVDVPTDRHATVTGPAGKRKRPERPEVAGAGGHTGAMIALVPAAEHVDRLAVDGGEPAEELHLTVMYLGEAADIPEDIRAGLYSVAAAYAASTAPIEGDGFAVEAFNPHAEDIDTALVMGVSGQSLADLHAGVSGGVRKLMTPPDNHAPWRPHVTLKYSDDLGELPGFVGKLGPVMFDRLRVAMGDEVTDYPLAAGGGEPFDVEGWAVGNAGKLRLGQPGGFRRCVKRLRDEPGVIDPEGLCATMHHRATGKWPGEGHIVIAGTSWQEELHARDGDGQFADKVGGGGKIPSIPGDKLGLAKRIKLTEGENLRASREFDVNGVSDAVPVGAAIAAPGGPEVRLGIVGAGDEKKWGAANLGSTLKLRPGDVDRISTALETENTKAKTRSVGLRKKFAELDRLDDARDEGRLDDAGEKRRAELEAWNRDLVADDMIGEGTIPAGEWGDLAYQVWGRDGEDADWGFKLAVRPPGDGEWRFPDDDSGVAQLDAPDMRRFLKQLGDLATKASSAPEVAAAMPTPPRPMPTPAELAAFLEYEEATENAVPGAHFHTLMHTEGVSTGRRVQMPGSWTWRTPPIPFNWERLTAMHGGTPEVVQVGLVTNITRMGREIHGWGMLDLNDPVALDYARKLAAGWVRGVSVGPDEQPMNMELIYSPSDPETVIQEVYHSGNIYEVTSSDGVAQATAYVEPLPALLDALEERGIEVARAAFEETKHKRDGGGKFAKKAGGGVPSVDVPAAPKSKTPTEPKAPRAARAKTAAKKAPKADAPAAPAAAPGTTAKTKTAAGGVSSLLRPSGSKAAARKNPKATAAAAAAMNGTFGGVEVRVEKATQSAGKTHVLASLYDAEGNKVGKTERTFHRGNGDDPDALWVSHDLLALEKDQQGAGFAQEWNAHTEKWYKESGVSHIRLEANIDVGGYAWARQGYDFADKATAEKMRDRAAGILDALTFELDFATPGTPPHDRALARAAGAKELLDQFNNNEYGSPGYPTPFDVANAGRQPGQGRADQWFGKLALLNSKWDGVKWL